MKKGPSPRVDLGLEIKVQNVVRDLICQGLVKSAHDCSEGGLAVALAECCFNTEGLFGAEVDLCSRQPPGDAAHVSLADQRSASQNEAATALFNESQSRIVISVAPKHLETALSILRNCGVSFQHLGKVAREELRIRVNDEAFRWPIAGLYDDWLNAIRRAVEEEAESIPSL
jgi:phosphoribosylformylglycinamidine synthase